MRIRRSAIVSPAVFATAVLVQTAVPAQVVSLESVDSSGVAGDGQSGDLSLFQGRPAAVSADGTVIAFESAATNLIPVDQNGVIDVFVHVRATGVTERVSVTDAGFGGDADSHAPALTADGALVVFWSTSRGLVANDYNGVADVFLHDRVAGTTERVSVRANGTEADGGSYRAAISADGRFVAFESDATNLVSNDTNGTTDIFVKDRVIGKVERVSVDSNGNQANTDYGGGSFDPSISGDGRFVAFSSRATNLVAGDTNGSYDVFVHDRATGVTERVSVDSSGAQASGTSWHPMISGDGNVVAFESFARDLVAGDTNEAGDVFVHDRTTGGTERVSVGASGAEADQECFDAAVNGDGSVVSFTSAAAGLVPVDSHGSADVFVRDRGAGLTTLVSIDCAWDSGSDASGKSALSADGSVVAFGSVAADLVDGDANGFADVFANDRAAPPVLAAWSNYGAGYAGTLGVPTLTARQNPVFGTTLDVDVSNSSGVWSVGLLIAGFSSASIPTSAGGTLLVDPFLLVLVPLPPAGETVTGAIPNDPSLCGTSLFLQCLELDPGAAHSISFTPGLELDFGH
jgi:Tol biopolymer transport system component